MPFAEDTSTITGPGEDFRERRLVREHKGAAKVRIDDAGTIIVAAGQEAGASGRAHGRDIEVFATSTFARKVVEVRRMNFCVAVKTQITVALVVGDDHQNISAGQGG